MNPPDGATAPKPAQGGPPADLGVLLVHGIGTQKRGATLRAWGGAILGWLRACLDDGRTGSVTASLLAVPRDPDSPAHFDASIRIGDEVERWRFAECWWAECFEPPTFWSLLHWLFGTLPTVVTLHVARWYKRRRDTLAGLRGWRRASNLIATLVLGSAAFTLALAVSPAVFMLLLVLAILGSVPAPVVRGWVRRALAGLAATVGDSHVLLVDETARRSILTRLARNLDWLSRSCRTVVIVAHSQGAAVAVSHLARVPVFRWSGIQPVFSGWPTHDAPGDSAGEPDRGQAAVPTTVTTLVTYGSGVNKLLGLADRNIGILMTGARLWMLFGSVWALLGTWSVVALIRADGIRDLWILLGMGLVAAASMVLATESANPETWGRRTGRSALTGILAWAVMAGTAATYLTVLVTEEPRIPLWGSATRVAFVGFVALAVYGLLVVRRALAHTRDRTVALPATIHTWFDLYTLADPVPNGSTQTTKEWWPTSVELVNERSLLRDHSGYWRNRDHFISLIVGVLGGTATTGLRPRLRKAIAVSLPAISERRRRRVRMLVAGRRVIAGMALIGVVVGAPVIGEAVLSDRPGLGVPAAALGIVLAAVLVHSTLATLWRRMDRRDQGRSLGSIRHSVMGG